MTLEEVSEQITPSWVENYAASYRYSYPWAMLFFPIFFGLLSLPIGLRSGAAFGLWVGTEALLVLAAIRWNTYRITLESGSVRAGWPLRWKSFPLTDVDLIQHLQGQEGGLLRVRHSDRILLTVSDDIDGFDDLVGFFRQYAKRHNLIFATRDRWDRWTQQAGKSGSGDDD